MTPATLLTRPASGVEELDPALANAFEGSAHAPARGMSRDRVRSREAVTASPRRYAQALMIVMLVGTTFRTYWTYSHYEHLDPSVWLSFVNGTGAAPEQYRVGVKLVAWWIMRHVGGGFRHSFALLDLVSSIVAGLLLYKLLERSRVYRAASGRGNRVGQWMGSGVFLALLFYYLSWLPWFEKAETLPSVGVFAGLLWLWSSAEGRARQHTALRVAGLLLLTVALALVRADVALCLSLGMLAVAATRRFGGTLSLARSSALGTSAACALVAAMTQGYMMRVAYPHATYGETPVFMLRHDIAEPLVLAPFVLFLLPVAWTMVAAWRSVRASEWTSADAAHGCRERDGASLGVLVGGLLYLPLWMTLGKLDEVRIFLPFALALLPLSTELLMVRIIGRVDAAEDSAERYACR